MFKSANRKNIFAPFIAFVLTIFSYMGFIGYLSIKGMNDTLTICFFGFGGFVLIIGVIVYLFIFNKSPLALQSETYRLEEKKLDLIAAKGNKFNVNPVNMVLNPSQIQLEEGEVHEN